jgi:hypothetical protein
LLAGNALQSQGKESGNSSFDPCLESLKMGIAPIAPPNGAVIANVVFQQVGHGNDS